MISYAQLTPAGDQLRGGKDPASVYKLALKAIAGGGEVTSRSLRGVEWNIADRCEAPVFVEVFTRGYTDIQGPLHGGRFVDLWTRCRRCKACLKMRSRLWTARAAMEIARSSRTWFVTLTLRPEEHYRMLIAGRVGRSRDDAVEFDARHRAISAEITRYLKRVRKESGAKLRYLSVAEQHKSGLPHYHLLIHEQEGAGRVSWSTLSEQWKLGFGKYKLVKGDGMLVEPGGKVAWYIAKYLSKSVLARVRASQRYGEPEGDPVVLRHSPEGVRGIDPRKGTRVVEPLPCQIEEP